MVSSKTSPNTQLLAIRIATDMKIASSGKKMPLPTALKASDNDLQKMIYIESAFVLSTVPIYCYF